MSLLEALILGIIQGLTEFLPVSSSGHLVLASAVFGIQTTDNLLFTVTVHGATAMATIVVFRKEIAGIFAGLFQFKNNESLHYTIKILISAVPVVIVGLLFEDKIEAVFNGAVILTGVMLFITGLLLAFTKFAPPRKGQVTYGKSVLIGIAQAIAVLPGISRSGTTIAAALLLGTDREKAAKFSFLMVLIPILGASGLKIIQFFKEPTVASNISAVTLAAGFVAAFVTGVVACKAMIRIVKKGKLIWFAVYCFVIGSIALISVLF